MPCKRIRRAMLILGIPAMLVCVSGGNCSGLSFVIPVEGGGSIEFNTVTLELFNATLFPVEPRLFIDVEDDSRR